MKCETKTQSIDLSFFFVWLTICFLFFFLDFDYYYLANEIELYKHILGCPNQSFEQTAPINQPSTMMVNYLKNTTNNPFFNRHNQPLYEDLKTKQKLMAEQEFFSAFKFIRIDWQSEQKDKEKKTGFAIIFFIIQNDNFLNKSKHPKLIYFHFANKTKTSISAHWLFKKKKSPNSKLLFNF